MSLQGNNNKQNNIIKHKAHTARETESTQMPKHKGLLIIFFKIRFSKRFVRFVSKEICKKNTI